MDNSTESCITSIPSRHIFIAWLTVYLLFLPVFLFVLYIGFNKWKKSQSSASGGLSHSDFFTLNMVAMEMTSIAGSCAVCYGYYAWNEDVATSGGEIINTTVTGQVLFHILTCVERYLAVVHPVTYLRLRREGGVTIRNISIASVWVISAVYTVLFKFLNDDFFYAVAGFVLSSLPLSLVIYCSVSVLCVLISPKPGERLGHRKKIDQSKRTTVHTMAAILGALVLRLLTDVTCYILYIVSPPLDIDKCVIIVVRLWPALPSSLVLPLLFFQRTGQLTVCK